LFLDHSQIKIGEEYGYRKNPSGLATRSNGWRFSRKPTNRAVKVRYLDGRNEGLSEIGV